MKPGPGHATIEAVKESGIARETACATTSRAVFPNVGQAVSPADFLSRQFVYSFIAACFFLLSTTARAATVQGAIFDEETTNAQVARTTVTLRRFPAPPRPCKPNSPTNMASTASPMSRLAGTFSPHLTHRGHAIGEYGQSRPGLPGIPFQVTDSDAANSESPPDCHAPPGRHHRHSCRR